MWKVIALGLVMTTAGCAYTEANMARTRYGNGPQAQKDLADCDYQRQLARSSYAGNPFLAPTPASLDTCMKAKGW